MTQQTATMTPHDRVASAMRNEGEVSPRVKKIAYGFLTAGPVVQTVMILAIGLAGYSWFIAAMDWIRWTVYLGPLQPIADLFGWQVKLGGVRTTEALLVRGTGWLISISGVLAFVQVIGAALMPFNAKLRHTFSVLLTGIPVFSLLYIVFRWAHLGLELDDMQKAVLWGNALFVVLGLVVALIVRAGIMAGRREIGVN